jgi:hypothetical protein
MVKQHKKDWETKKMKNEEKKVGEKQVSIEVLLAFAILSFCENLAELGCPRDAEPDMWFRELSDEDKVKVSSKLLDIIERN